MAATRPSDCRPALNTEDIVSYCLENPMSCLGQLANGPKSLHPSERPEMHQVKVTIALQICRAERQRRAIKHHSDQNIKC